MRKRFLAAILASTMMVSLSGCQSLGGFNPKDFNTESFLTEAEAIDYYTEALSYDTIASRTTSVNKVTYESQDVDKDYIEQLKDAAKIIQSELFTAQWQQSFHVSKFQHQYIKYLLDDKVASLKQAGDIKEALGYYFVDFVYNLGANAPATFKENSKYLGIHGAFTSSYTGGINIDTSFMNQANQKVYEYCLENRTESGTGALPDANQNSPRLGFYDVDMYNKVAGMSKTQSAFMPPIDIVITTTAPSGSISGYGVFPQGQFSLSNFGYSRQSLSGTMTLRYVFKQNILDPAKIEFINVYATEYTLNNALDVKNTAIIPDFAKSEIETLVERSDRAIANQDLAAMLNGKIYPDIGVGILNGFYGNTCYVQRHMSKVTDFLAKEGNKYLINVETISQEGPKKSSYCGTYVEHAYMVVEQDGLEFKITDYVIYDRKMTSEPQIDIDSSILKRLAALNLSGAVPEDAKPQIKELLNSLYEASTARKLEPMYACFNSDTKILSSKQYEYLNSQLRSWLIRYGIETPATYLGRVSEWVGGAANQVELITEEIINYEGKDIGQYMQAWYLVSNFNDIWVIDDMKVIEAKDISGAELQTVIERISAGAEGTGSNSKDTASKTLELMGVVIAEEPDKIDQSEGQIDGQEPDGNTPDNPNTDTPTDTPVDNPPANNTPAGGNTGTGAGGYVWDAVIGDWVPA